MITDYFAGNALWYLVKQSDPISKLILWILFGISVLCWTVFLSKLILFYIQRRSLRKAYRQLQSVKTFACKSFC
jgi:biopolymer transport protein ExbB/TolQ